MIQGILILFQKKFELLPLPFSIKAGLIALANIGSEIENTPDPFCDNVILLSNIFDSFIISKFLFISSTCLSDNLEIYIFIFV